MSSIFSKIIKGDIPSYKVAEDDDHYAFLDINPLVKGHTLVIPKQEVDYIFDLDNATLASLNVFAKKVAKGIEKVVTCKRVGIMVVGTEVPHAHIHLIPFNSEAELNFARARVKLNAHDMAALAMEINAAI